MADQLDPPPSPPFRAYAAREEQTRQLLVEAAASAPIRKRRLQERAAILNQSMALGIARPYHGRGVEAEDVDQVKASAADSAANVKDEAASTASEVKDSSQEAAAEVRRQS